MIVYIESSVRDTLEMVKKSDAVIGIPIGGENVAKEEILANMFPEH